MVNETDSPYQTPEEYYDTLQVEKYYDKIHRATWARRTAGFIAGVTIGVVIGAAIGAVAAFVPPLLAVLGVAGAAGAGALPVAATMASFAGIGGLMGFAALGLTGASAGATAAGMEEKEKREKIEKLKDYPPALRAQLAEQLNGDAPPKEKPPHLFSWKVAAVTGPLFATFGALLAVTPGMAPAAVLLGFSGGTYAAIAAAASVFGMFGAVIGTRMSYISNEVTNFYFRVISGQIFEKKSYWADKIMRERGRPVQFLQEPQHEQNSPETSFAAKAAQTRFSLQGLIEQREAGIPTPGYCAGAIRLGINMPADIKELKTNLQKMRRINANKRRIIETLIGFHESSEMLGEIVGFIDDRLSREEQRSFLAAREKFINLVDVILEDMGTQIKAELGPKTGFVRDTKNPQFSDNAKHAAHELPEAALNLNNFFYSITERLDEERSEHVRMQKGGGRAKIGEQYEADPEHQKLLGEADQKIRQMKDTCGNLSDFCPPQTSSHSDDNTHLGASGVYLERWIHGDRHMLGGVA